MRYYYDDPIKAAWMIKHFDMKIVCGMPSHPMEYNSADSFILRFVDLEHEGWGESASASIDWYERRVYIHPDCYELLKPRVGDLMTNIGLRVWRIQEIRENGELIFHDERGSEILGLAPEMEIIQRDNKVWFAPKVGE